MGYNLKQKISEGQVLFAINLLTWLLAVGCPAEGTSNVALKGMPGCRGGKYLSATSKGTACVDCPRGFYCLGGTATQSVRISCNYRNDTTTIGLTTKGQGSTSRADCVNRPGYRYVPSQDGNPTAVRCGQNMFSLGLLSQRSCNSCLGGLRTDPSDDGLKTSSAACKVPPGWYATKAASLLRCPRGKFRDSYAALAAAQECLQCPKGTTTGKAMSGKLDDCQVLVPGWFWTNPTVKLKQLPVAPTRPPMSNGVGVAGDALPASLCPQNYYCPGGVWDGSADGKASCDTVGKGLWTKGMGARGPSECLIPPGHYFNTAASPQMVVKCSTGNPTNPRASPGTYQPVWGNFSGGVPSVTSCISCGEGILSEDTEPLSVYAAADDGTGAPNTLLVPRTNMSCWIRRGQAIVNAGSGNSAVKAVICNSGTNYGTFGDDQSDVSYGLSEEDCLECPFGTTTKPVEQAKLAASRYYCDTVTGGFYSPKACLTRPGYGYEGGVAIPCPKGFYNTAEEDDADKCTACPYGTTTNSTMSTSLSNCSYVLPGFGYPVADNPVAAIRPCAPGTYADVNRPIEIQSTAGACFACPNGTTSTDDGSTSASLCDECPLGYGMTNSSNSACVPCPSGTFAPDTRLQGDYSCTPCPAGANTYYFYYGNTSGNIYSPDPISRPGSASQSFCFAEFSQLEGGNWRLDSAGSIVNSTASSLLACVDACRVYVGGGCQFLNFDYSSNRCQLRVPAAVQSGSNVLAFKVPANTNIVQASSMGTGMFSWWSDDQAQEVGQTISSITTGAAVNDCLSACNEMSVCAAVRLVGYTAATRSVAECHLLQGFMDYANSIRTLVRTKIQGMYS